MAQKRVIEPDINYADGFSDNSDPKDKQCLPEGHMTHGELEHPEKRREEAATGNEMGSNGSFKGGE